MENFFSYDAVEETFETHKTLELARRRANSFLIEDRANAEQDDGWACDVEGICYGEIKGIMEEVVERNRLNDFILKEL